MAVLAMCPALWKERRGADPPQEGSLSSPAPSHSHTCRRGAHPHPWPHQQCCPRWMQQQSSLQARGAGHSLGSVLSQEKEDVSAVTGEQLHMILPVMGPEPAESKGQKGQSSSTGKCTANNLGAFPPSWLKSQISPTTSFQRSLC